MANLMGILYKFQMKVSIKEPSLGVAERKKNKSRVSLVFTPDGDTGYNTAGRSIV
jgi:hypothetical protein